MYAVIDMGSNTMRLGIYHNEDGNFKQFFHKKEMVGLAGYVKDGFLTDEGIEAAASVLKEFGTIVRNLGIEHVMVFATASLRNVENTEEAAVRLWQMTGFKIHVISGEEEAKLDFKGAVSQIRTRDGILVDIGGGSTEIVTFYDKTVLDALSIPVGSLSLFKKHVKRILPKDEERAKIRGIVNKQLNDSGLMIMKPESGQLVGIGGSIRALGRLYRHFYELPEECNVMEVKKLKKMYRQMAEKKNGKWQLILKLCPDRIHTLIPGFLILLTIIERYEIETVVISRCGLREGYLMEYAKEETAQKETVGEEAATAQDEQEQAEDMNQDMDQDQPESQNQTEDQNQAETEEQPKAGDQAE